MIIKIVCVLFVVVLVAVIISCYENFCKDNNKVKMSFKEAMDLVELPVITFYHNKKKLNFLLDTGSNLCVLNSRELKGLKYTKLDSHGSIYGMEGKATKTDHISLEFTHNNKTYKAEFQVLDMKAAFDNIKKESGVTVHGILGSKFFEKYQYILDFAKYIAYSKK